MGSFSFNTEQVLIKSKWFKGRIIDISEYQRCLVAENYKLSSCVENFLAEFGGLKIEFLTQDQDSDNFHFDVCKAVAEIDPSWVFDDYTKRLLREKLCVVGQAYSNHMTLIMSEKGELFGGFDDLLWLVGKDSREAIEVLCTKNGFKEIS